jgi:phosphopantetheine adenylyltransferase
MIFFWDNSECHHHRSSLLSRRTEHSVVFVFKLIQGLVDCSDLLSQVTFKVNRPACRTKNTFFLPTRRTNTELSSPVVRMMINYQNIEDMADIFCCGIDATKLLRGAISSLSLETCKRML